MNYIITTNLRTKSSELVEVLSKGEHVSLIHRSKVVGIIKPSIEAKPLTKEGIEKIRKLAKAMNLPKLSYKERKKDIENIWKKNMAKVFLDTNYFIDAIHRKPEKTILDLLENFA